MEDRRSARVKWELTFSNDPDEAAVAHWEAVVRKAAGAEVAVRTARASVRQEAEGTEGEHTVQIASEGARGGVGIDYAGGTVTLSGHGRDACEAKQWLERLGEALLEGTAPSQRDDVPESGCFAYESGARVHLDADTLRARRDHAVNTLHAQVAEAIRAHDAERGASTLGRVERSTRVDAKVAVAHERDEGGRRAIEVRIPEPARSALRDDIERGLAEIIDRCGGRRPARRQGAATVAAARALGAMHDRRGAPRGDWSERWPGRAVPQAGALATMAYTAGGLAGREAAPADVRAVHHALAALTLAERPERGVREMVKRVGHDLIRSAGSHRGAHNGAVLEAIIEGWERIATTPVLDAGAAEHLAICARRLLVRLDPGAHPGQWPAIIATIARSDTPEQACAAALRGHWMGGFHEGEAYELVGALEGCQEPITSARTATALRAMANALGARILGAERTVRESAAIRAIEEVERLCAGAEGESDEEDQTEHGTGRAVDAEDARAHAQGCQGGARARGGGDRRGRGALGGHLGGDDRRRGDRARARERGPRHREDVGAKRDALDATTILEGACEAHRGPATAPEERPPPTAPAQAVSQGCGIDTAHGIVGERDAADDHIVGLVGAHAEHETIEDASSDRTLMERVRALGAGTRGVRSLGGEERGSARNAEAARGMRAGHRGARAHRRSRSTGGARASGGDCARSARTRRKSAGRERDPTARGAHRAARGDRLDGRHREHRPKRHRAGSGPGGKREGR